MAFVDNSGGHPASGYPASDWAAASGWGEVPGCPRGFRRAGAPGEFSPAIHGFCTAHPEASVEISPLILSRNDSSRLMRSPIFSQA